MPVIKSAIKKLRRDRKREKQNDLFRKNLDRAVRSAKKQKTASKIKEATSLVDRGVKKNLLHKNKAARIKSSLSRLARLGSARQAKPAAKTPVSVSKTTKSKPAKKRTK